MSKKTEKLVLRVDLDVDLKSDFLRIKEEHGFTNNTEVLRFCIKQIASSKIYMIPDEIWKKIEELVSDSRIREKYYVNSINNFLDRAISLFIQKTNADRSNLHDIEFRMGIKNPEKQNLANLLISLQLDNPSLGVTLDNLTQQIQSLKREKVEFYLDQFIREELVQKYIAGARTYYFAKDRSFMQEEPVQY